ncbi:hypothetical protein [Bradyrhizobium sp. BR 10261]|uniref:hypothetical protein n=1 Tax=Bradyrhizobium sp. BR 10261 TaxID=2749992 RepID=UPI001C645831|nr:hypothetical protein [Bradyrhizobium sp. BR 10261]MBW7965968.1 hypothetical protein [Bradyrhizobium sp. BR 10261]
MSVESQPYDGATTGVLAKPSWRLIPQIDRDPTLVAGVQEAHGRVVLCCGVGLLAVLFWQIGIDFSAAGLALACAYAGRYRRVLIFLATSLLLWRSGFLVDRTFLARLAIDEGVADRIDQPLVSAAMVAVTFALFSVLLAMQGSGAIVLRRPTLGLLIAFLALVVVTQASFTAGTPRVLLWSFLMTFQPYLWFLAYGLVDATKERAPVWQHLGVFHPFWGATLTPFGKGLSYLRRFEAKTSEELAVTQLKGVKLAAWVLILAIGKICFGELVHGQLRLPMFDDNLLQYLAGHPQPRLVGWASVVVFFVDDLLSMTVFGGVIVATARLAGFRLLRNTYRPLQSATLAEFWNRYYFYYKELLVDHFFYPTFVRCFRGHRRLRMFFATFTAACVGNLLFHFIRDIHFVGEMGLWRAVVGEQSHAFYTFVLAVSVGLSQMRRVPQPAPKGWLRGRLLPCLWVSGFFCVIHIFDAPLDREHSLWQRAEFLFYLLGVTT